MQIARAQQARSREEGAARRVARAVAQRVEMGSLMLIARAQQAAGWGRAQAATGPPPQRSARLHTV